MPLIVIQRTLAFALLVFLLPALTAAGNAKYADEGLASWYGGKFQGRLTANGEVFDTNQLTAAHRTLPFGTRVQVTNIDTGAQVIVRINDRGPFVEGRIIDLSKAAADAIGIGGVAAVRIEVVESPPPVTEYVLQVGSFRDRHNALRMKKNLESRGFSVEIRTTEGGLQRVMVICSAQALEATKRALAAQGIGSPIARPR